MSKPTVLIMLQNAWSPLYAGREWPRESWLRALRDSRSGDRLRHLTAAFEQQATIWYDNTTPRVVRHARERAKPDRLHVEEVLQKQQPRVVVTCGDQAGRLLSSMWQGHLVRVPHPAHRLLTTLLLAEAGKTVRKLLKRREPPELWTFKQVKGKIIIDTQERPCVS